LNPAYYFPCRVKGELIAILGVGRKEGTDLLNSEEADLLQALAGQAATAFMNGRLYRSLREKADELQQLTDYNESILEDIDSGILVVDLQGRVARCNRAMEALYGKPREELSGRALDDLSPTRSARRCGAASPPAGRGTTRSPTSTSCTCPPRTGARGWSTCPWPPSRSARASAGGRSSSWTT
jgi:PAS domain-containing protein